MTAQDSNVIDQDPFTLYPLPDKPKKKIRVGLIGFGHTMKACHAPSIQHLQSLDWALEVTAIAEIDTSRLAEGLATFPKAKAFTHSDTLLNETDLCDAVLICLWPPESATACLKAVKKGFHVLVEKPVSELSADFAAIVDAEKEFNQLRVQVGYNRRSQMLAGQFKEALQEMQPIQHIRARLYRTQRKEAGFYEDVAVHPINFIEYCIGPLRLNRVEFWPQVEVGEIPSGMRADLRAPNGITVELDIRPAAGRHQECYEIISHKKTLYLTYCPVERHSDPAELSSWDGTEKTSLYFKTDYEPMEKLHLQGFLSQMASFIRFAAGENGRPICSLKEARESVAVVESIISEKKTTTLQEILSGC